MDIIYYIINYYRWFEALRSREFLRKVVLVALLATLNIALEKMSNRSWMGYTNCRKSGTTITQMLIV